MVSSTWYLLISRISSGSAILTTKWFTSAARRSTARADNLCCSLIDRSNRRKQHPKHAISGLPSQFSGVSGADHLPLSQSALADLIRSA
jgi:hypothetical protein